MKDLPILLLCFNRPLHIKRLIAVLRPLAPKNLYVHCDGPRRKHESDIEMVAKVREVISQDIDWECNLKTYFRAENVGLRNSVVGAINWLFEYEEYVVVFEDDCLPDPGVFPFCSELLQRFAGNDEIMHISCTNWAAAHTQHRADSYLFSHFAFVTGWATWKRAWQHMTLDLDGLEEFEKSGWLDNILHNRLSRFYMFDKFRSTRARQNNSWAYAWQYSIMRRGGLGITSRAHLVENIGFGEPSASNTKGNDARSNMEVGKLSFPLEHPAKQKVDPDMEQLFFYASHKKRFKLLPWAIKHWATKFFGRLKARF